MLSQLDDLVKQHAQEEYTFTYLQTLGAYEEFGTAPFTDIPQSWGDENTGFTQSYTIWIIAISDLVFLIGVVLVIFCSFRREIMQFFKDPNDRLINVGGYEESSKGSKSLMHFLAIYIGWQYKPVPSN